MSSRNKAARRSKREEQQANKVIKIVFVSLIVLALAMILAFSFFA